jgi:integrase
MIRKLTKKLIETMRLQEKQKLQSMATVKDLADQYMRERASCQSTSHQEMDKYIWKHHILPVLGGLKVSSLDRNDMAKFYDSFQERPAMCKRTFALLSKALNFAELWGYRPKYSNPCLHLKKDKVQMQRLLSQEEMNRLMVGLSHEEKEGHNLWPAYAVHLLLVTGCHFREVLDLLWTDVDFENKCLRLQDNKAGKKNIPLSRTAFELLMRIPQNPSNPFVICGEGGGLPLASLHKFWRELREKVGLEDVHFYDLRYNSLLSLYNKSVE